MVRVEKALSPLDARTLAGGRVSFDTPNDGWLNTLDVLTGTIDQDYHQGLQLDEYAVRRTSPSKLLEFLVETSPELSRAYHDFHTMCNPGVEVDCLFPGTGEVNKSAQKVLEDEVLSPLADMYGDPSVVYNRLFTTIFMRGGAATETVLGYDARGFADLATPDPAYFTWKKLPAGPRGKVWFTGQYQGTTWVNLDEYATFRYIPFLPGVGKPRGRSIATSSIYICVFLMSILHDLKRVIQQQGYPRIDVSIDFDKLRQEMPQNATKDELRSWGEDLVARVKAVYRSLKPDDTYVHSSAVTVNVPNGALSNVSLGALDALFHALERMATRALKTMPLLMATTDGVSEANANRQWEIHVQGIKNVQHVGEWSLQNAFNTAMRARGIRTSVRVRFAELRAAEMLRDTQVDLLKTTVAEARYWLGYYTQAQACQYATGVDKPAEEEPRQQQVTDGAGGGVQGLGGGQPERPPTDSSALRGWLLNGIAHRLVIAARAQSPSEAGAQRLLTEWEKAPPQWLAELLPELGAGAGVRT